MEAALYHAAQWAIFAMGILAVALSAYYIKFFRAARRRHRLAFVMQLFLVEQIVTSAGTLLFSINSLWVSSTGGEFALWNSISPGYAILIRAAMFSAMILSTAKLSMEVARIASQEGE